jgi:hypothetical protein
MAALGAGVARAQSPCGGGQIQILSQENSAVAVIETRFNGGKISECGESNSGFSADALNNGTCQFEFASAGFKCKVNASLSSSGNQFAYNATAEAFYPEGFEDPNSGLTRRLVATQTTNIRIKAVGGDILVNNNLLHDGDQTVIGFSITLVLDKPGSRSSPVSGLAVTQPVCPPPNEIHWINPSGGDFSNANNWNPHQVPANRQGHLRPAGCRRPGSYYRLNNVIARMVIQK